jgi:hypothetical protein
VPPPVSSANRIFRPLVLTLKWILVLVAVIVHLVVIPFVELVRELGSRLRRGFAPRR